MPITKTATEVLIKESANTPMLDYLARLVGRTYKASRLAGKGALWALKHPVKGLYTGVAKPAIGLGLNTANAIGDLSVKHPKAMLPALFAAGIGATSLGGMVNKNIIHADPNMDVTMYRPRPWLGEGLSKKVPIPIPNIFSDVQYNNKGARDYYSKQKLIFG